MNKFTFFRHLISATSPGWLVGALNPGRDRYRGEIIDAKAFAVGRLANLVREPGVMPTIPHSRAQLLKSVRLFDADGPDLKSVRDINLAGPAEPVPSRLYSDNTQEKSPAMVFFHGGGFVQGDLESHDKACRKLAKWWGGAVIAVDYRLAPEHTYPAGVDDCIDAYLDVVARADEFGLDGSNIGVGGDSAGGCFAAAVAQQVLRLDGPVPKFQVLLYPVTDGHLNSTSVNELSEAYILTKERMTWYRDLYAGSFSDYSDPKFSPLLAESMKGLPDSYVLTVGFDPLVDDGIAYAEKLRADGVNVTHRHFPGQIHALINLTKVVPEGTIALKEIADWLTKTSA